MLESLLDTGVGVLNFGRVDRGVVETLENGDGLLVATLLGKPTGGVGNDEGGEDEDADEDTLKGDRYPPDDVASHGLGKSVVDPVGEHDTEVENGKVDGNELTTGDGGDVSA